ncbi:hypothetical protein OAD66_01770 [Bacteroidia bacterium]|nr:hypothetical protein [Bacteroidia bacterium]
MRIITIVILAILTQSSWAQHNKNSYQIAAGMPLSFTDAPTAAGFGASFGLHYTAKSDAGFGVEVDFDRVFGGSKSLTATKDYYFSSFVGSVIPSVDYTFSMFREKKLQIIPGLGVGFVAYSTKGAFYNPNSGIVLYKTYGRPHFETVFDNGGNIVEIVTKKSGVTIAASPTITLAYKVKYNVKFFARFGYLLTNTDDLDAFNIATSGNQNKDILQVNHVGLNYLMYKRRRR